MAARKKVTKTAKAGATAQVIRSKPTLTRGKGVESTTARGSSPKNSNAARAGSKAVAANSSEKPAMKKAETAASKPATASKSAASSEAETIKAKAETARQAEAAQKPEAAPKAPAARKAEVSRKPEAEARKPEIRAQVNRDGTAAPENNLVVESGGSAPHSAPVKGVVAPVATKLATAAPATVATDPAKVLKPAPAMKTTERETSGGDQKTMKNSVNRHGFKLSEFVVYPAHGVGQIVAIEEQEVAGFKLELFVINFVKDKMTLRVPVGKVTGVGMRKLSDPEQARRSLEILTGRARIKRTMWSRRAQEYEAKINSGDINAIAEVVRDLFRSEAQPEQSYSERQLYEAALDRMMREIAAVQKVSEPEALKVIEVQLRKNTKRGVKPEGGEAGEGDEAGIEEAA
jgi:CarD family transcriptional regulator